MRMLYPEKQVADSESRQLVVADTEIYRVKKLEEEGPTGNCRL